MKIFKWIRSLFTDDPIPITKYIAWYYVRGKKKSAFQIAQERVKQTQTNDEPTAIKK